MALSVQEVIYCLAKVSIELASSEVRRNEGTKVLRRCASPKAHVEVWRTRRKSCFFFCCCCCGRKIGLDCVELRTEIVEGEPLAGVLGFTATGYFGQ